jgi:hypothetical protein
MHARSIGVLIFIFSGSLLGGDEHAACEQPSAYKDYGVKALLSIARSCKVDEVAELFYNRANHIRRVKKYFQFESKINKSGMRDNMAYIDAYRIHIGMAEALLGKALAPNATQTLSRLNLIYERSGEIAELRFKGYDLLANERQRRVKSKSHI